VARKRQPELTFQDHIAAYLIREHGYGMLEQAEITDAAHVIAEDHLWAFLTDSQLETVRKLADDYGTDARDEVFKALHAALRHTPLWLLLRQGLPVRGVEFRLFYPKPRSSASTAIHLLDHIIFNAQGYFSFLEAGRLPDAGA
jgi:type I restriction enzyme R subunit